MVSDSTRQLERLTAGLLALLLSLPVFAEPLRDPTRSPDQQPPASVAGDSQPEPIGQGRHWRLQAVFIRASDRQAIASGHTLSVGQRIEGVRVLAIEPDHVLLADADGEFRLRWPGHQHITSTEESPQS